MKKLVIILVLISTGIYNLFAQSTDSLSSSINLLKHNEIGLSLNGMNDLAGSNASTSLTFTYKRIFENYAFRFGVYNIEEKPNHITDKYTKINDSLFSKSTYNLNKSTYGIRVGLEKYNMVSDKICLFYGVDLNAMYLEELTSKTETEYKPQTLISEFAEFGYSAPIGTKTGYGVGLSPVIGISQFYTPFVSTTLQLDVSAYYSKIKDQDFSLILDEKFKLIINFRF